MSTKLTVTTQLTGSEKQVAWATSIRDSFIEDVNASIEMAEKAAGQAISEDTKARLESVIAEKSEAKWWIDKEMNFRQTGGFWMSEVNNVFRGTF